MRSRTAIATAALVCLAALSGPAGAGDADPQEVLVGSDTQPIADFPLVARQTVEGTYEAETGGARQVIVIGPAEAGGWRAVRQVIEPGEAPFERSYVLSGEDAVLSGPESEIEIRTVEGGVVVLEREDDIVPPDLWIFYSAR